MDEAYAVHDINVSTSSALDVMSTIQRSKQRNVALENKQIANWKRQKDDCLSRGLEVKCTKRSGRITAGSEVQLGNYSLNNPDLAITFRVKLEKKEQECSDEVMRAYKQRKKWFEYGIKAMASKQGWTHYQYGHMLNFKQLPICNMFVFYGSIPLLRTLNYDTYTSFRDSC